MIYVLFKSLRFTVLSIASLMAFCLPTALTATCGKVEIAPTLLRLELLECGRVHKTMDMGGIKGDLNWIIKDGYCLKPNFLCGWGGGSFYQVGIGVGRCLPITKKIVLVPSVGYSYSHLSTEIDIEDFGLKDIKDKFDSYTPYVALEVTYNFTKIWRCSALVQYGWSRSKNKVGDFPSCHNKSCGPAYGFQVERDLNSCWSLNLGVGYNLTLSKEKHGLRGKGLKFGVAYWF